MKSQETKKVHLHVVIDAEVHRQMKAQAALRGVSLAELVRSACMDWLENNR